jgi:hypothetical protein
VSHIKITTWLIMENFVVTCQQLLQKWGCWLRRSDQRWTRGERIKKKKDPVLLVYDKNHGTSLSNG